MSYDFADRLIELRRAKGMSQEELAGTLGLSRQAISKWERAESAPDIGNLVALSELYGVSLDEIVRGQADATPAPATEVEAETEVGLETEGEVEAGTGEDAATAVAAEAEAGTAPRSVAATPESDKGRSEAEAATAPASPSDAQSSAAPHVEQPAAYTAPQAPVAPVYEHRTSKAWRMFPYPLLCVIIFLFLGFFCGLWHPAWIIFLTIPFYYWVVNLILHDPAYIAAHSPNAAASAEVPAEGAQHD